MASPCLALTSSLLLASYPPPAASLPAWSDLFPSLRPSQDRRDADYEELLEFVDEDQARQFVTINTGGTTFNTTLNLTGHILLGLGIASSLLLYMWLRALDQGGGYGGYGYSTGGYDYRRRKRFAPDDDGDDKAEAANEILSRVFSLEEELLQEDVSAEKKGFSARRRRCRLGAVICHTLDAEKTSSEGDPGGSLRRRAVRMLRFLQDEGGGGRGRDVSAAEGDISDPPDINIACERVRRVCGGGIGREPKEELVEEPTEKVFDPPTATEVEET